MRGKSRAAGLLAAAVLVCALVPAAADMLEDAPPPPTTLYFFGADLWHEGDFLHGGVLWSPKGLAQDGFTLKLIFGAGAYQYHSGALGDTEVTGRQTLASLMPGWRFKRPDLELTIFGGIDLQHHKLSTDDPSNGIAGDHAGLRGGFDLWYQPSRGTMFAANASLSTISTSYDARASYGWRLWHRFYAGPEVQALASDGYRQYRFGAHVTALKWQTFELSAGLGYARDSSHRDGAYGRVGLITRR